MTGPPPAHLGDIMHHRRVEVRDAGHFPLWGILGVGQTAYERIWCTRPREIPTIRAILVGVSPEALASRTVRRNRAERSSNSSRASIACRWFSSNDVARALRPRLQDERSSSRRRCLFRRGARGFVNPRLPRSGSNICLSYV